MVTLKDRIRFGKFCRFVLVDPMTRTLEELEKEAILQAIMDHGEIREAARALGICHSTIYDKLKRYGLKPKANHIIRELRRQKLLPLSKKPTLTTTLS